jgi:hypothetical protein
VSSLHLAAGNARGLIQRCLVSMSNRCVCYERRQSEPSATGAHRPGMNLWSGGFVVSRTLSVASDRATSAHNRTSMMYQRWEPRNVTFVQLTYSRERAAQASLKGVSALQCFLIWPTRAGYSRQTDCTTARFFTFFIFFYT